MVSPVRNVIVWYLLMWAPILFLHRGAVAAGAFEVYVKPDGDDGAAGTLDKPFRTTARARDALRQRKDRRAPATVHLRGGTYYLSEPLVLTPDDGGTAEAP